MVVFAVPPLRLTELPTSVSVPSWHVITMILCCRGSVNVRLTVWPWPGAEPSPIVTCCGDAVS